MGVCKYWGPWVKEDRGGCLVWAMGTGGLGWVFDSVWAHG